MYTVVVLEALTNNEFALNTRPVRREWVAAMAGASWAELYPEDIVMLVKG